MRAFNDAKEVRDWLNAEIARLKDEHAQKKAEWATVHQSHDQSLLALQTQVAKAEKRKSNALEALNNMSRVAELTENK